jgi:hypothetical protein
MSPPGHRGRIYRVEPNGQSSLIWTAPQPEIFALALGPDGALYAGSSPGGKVYRIQNGTASEYFDPAARYIWALAFGKDGALYVGTGDQGKVFRVARAGQGEVYYETGQTHITCLAIDSEGRLLAGSEPNGILYRITARKKPSSFTMPACRRFAPSSPDPMGHLCRRARWLGGAANRRGHDTIQPGAAATPVTAPGTTITVTDEANTQSGLELKAKAEAPKPAPPPVTTPYATVVDNSGVEKSALYKILPDNTVETLWTSKEENAYDLLLSGTSIIFSTDAQGRIYQLGADKRLTLMAQTNEGETTRLIASQGSLIAATGTMGKLFRLGTSPGIEGSYEAPVHDASTVARWGQLSWRADKPSNTQLTFRTRSGNSARPDKTWSDWSGPLSDPNGSALKSPNARFIQWRADFRATQGSTPVLSAVTVSYLPQNTPPVIKSINVTTTITAAPSNAKAVQPAALGAYSITVTDTGEAGASSVSGTTTQNIARGVSQQIVISWQAEDPDGDRLLYALYFRGDEENQWKLLRSNFGESSLTLDGDIFADGKYYFRLVASDKAANPGATAREAEIISPPVLFDNTPPAVTAAPPRRSGSHVEVDIEAKDAASALRRAEYSLDAMAWVPLEAADGVIDSREERFLLRLDNIGAGEHLIVIRVFDSSNNAGLAKVVVR